MWQSIYNPSIDINNLNEFEAMLSMDEIVEDKCSSVKDGYCFLWVSFLLWVFVFLFVCSFLDGDEVRCVSRYNVCLIVMWYCDLIDVGDS